MCRRREAGSTACARRMLHRPTFCSFLVRAYLATGYDFVHLRRLPRFGGFINFRGYGPERHGMAPRKRKKSGKPIRKTVKKPAKKTVAKAASKRSKRAKAQSSHQRKPVRAPKSFVRR